MAKSGTASFLRAGYPFDLDAGLRHTRPKTGIDFFPYPYIVNNVSGFLKLFDADVWFQAYGKNPFGPGVNSAPINVQWQITPPGLTKYGVGF